MNLFARSQFNLVEIEQIRLLYRSTVSVVLANLFIGLVLVYALWDVTSRHTLLVWLEIIIGLSLLRSILFVLYRFKFNVNNARQFSKIFITSNALSGLIWGLGAVAMFPEQVEYQLFILFVLCGMGAGSLPSLGVYLPAFYSYFPVSILPIGIKLLHVGEKFQIALGLMAFAYVIVLSILVLNIHRAIRESLQLRFENIELVQQLREQKEEAEQANISKSKFLAAASHDLRQPLHALTLFTSVLDEYITSSKARKVVDQIKSSVNALQSLFNALLDISRLEAGVMIVDKGDFQLQPLLEKLANEYEPQAVEKGLRLRRFACDYVARSDPSLVEQILRNYLSNAIRYTDKGEVQIECSVSNDNIKVSVIDTGRGIPQSEQKAIFREFHQLHNPERDRSKGLGLGLAIAQRSAKLLKHRIGLESKPDKGSTFWIEIDRTSTAQSNEVADIEITAHISGQSAQKPLLVVIDDEISVLEGTRQLLDAWNCEVITAVDLASVQEQLKQYTRKPDAIIADYRLRDNQTGIEAITAIHAQYGELIPALIVTGDIATESLREVSQSGFQVLHKPVAPAKLRAFLRHLQ